MQLVIPKKCKQCGNEFAPYPHSRHRIYCSVKCRNRTIHLRYVAKNPERYKEIRKAIDKRFYEKNREKICERQRRLWQTDKERLRGYARTWVENHKEVHRARNRRTYDRNKEKIQKKTREKRMLNRLIELAAHLENLSQRIDDDRSR